MSAETPQRRFTDDELVQAKRKTSWAITHAAMEIGNALGMTTGERVALATALTISAVDHLTKVRS